MTKKYRSDAFAAIHETMEALHEVGTIDKQTMRQFDEACLTPIQVLSPEEIKLLRLREHISQPVFEDCPARFACGRNCWPACRSMWARATGQSRPDRSFRPTEI